MLLVWRAFCSQSFQPKNQLRDICPRENQRQMAQPLPHAGVLLSSTQRTGKGHGQKLRSPCTQRKSH